MMQKNESVEEAILPNLSLLYVEDEEETRIELARYLKRRVGKLCTAENGAEGLKKFGEVPVDIIITDLKMPIMGGMEMVKEIRKIDSKVPIVMITALSDSERILSAMDLDVVKYVVKPINPQGLVKILRNIGEKIFQEKQEMLLDEDLWASKNEKTALEKEIERSCATMIKNWTGKGPRKIQAFIQGRELSVEIYEMLTPMEKNLLRNPKHTTLVAYFRRSFYEEIQGTLENTCSGILKRRCSFIDLEQQIKDNWECLRFEIGKSN